MGYRVGLQCFGDERTADDLFLSQQRPTITADGRLIRPVRGKDNWQLDGRPIKLSFPECSMNEQIAQGGFFGLMLVSLGALVFGIRAAQRLLHFSGVESNDD